MFGLLLMVNVNDHMAAHRSHQMGKGAARSGGATHVIVTTDTRCGAREKEKREWRGGVFTNLVRRSEPLSLTTGSTNFPIHRWRGTRSLCRTSLRRFCSKNANKLFNFATQDKGFNITELKKKEQVEGSLMNLPSRLFKTTSSPLLLRLPSYWPMMLASPGKRYPWTGVCI